jgi:hypothetical protein
MDLSGDPYELLGVKKDASQDDIQKACCNDRRDAIAAISRTRASLDSMSWDAGDFASPIGTRNVVQ